MMLYRDNSIERIEMSTEELIALGQFEGIVEDLAPEVYYKSEAYASNTILNIIANKSPAHAKEYMVNPPEPTPALEFGQQLHCAVLERDRFHDLYACVPDIRRGTKEWKQLEELHLGKQLVKKETFDQLCRMIEAINNHPQASKLLSRGKSEVSAFWIDPMTGIPMKARFDKMDQERGIITDLKSTSDGSFKGFQKSVQAYGYHRQSAIYLDGFNHLTGANTDMFPHVVIEKEPPYAVAVYVLDNATIDKGRGEYHQLQEVYAECKKTGVWPAYSADIQTMNLLYF